MGQQIEFEDILDGYFPLSLSIADLLRRNELSDAALTLAFAPIVAVKGLPHDAPVPLNIRSGRAGMIDQAHLSVTLSDTGAQIWGTARWRWLDGAAIPETLDPMIRLAEPALVSVCAAENRADDFPCILSVGRSAPDTASVS